MSDPVTYLSPIDPHVHLRGTEYPEHNFADLAFRDARAVGLCAMFEQPNPTPNLITPEAVEARRQQLKNAAGDLMHGVHIGLTTDKRQVKAALAAVSRRPFGLAADKIFYTHSTGDMGITDPAYQEWIWRWKGATGYRGVSIGHFEDETEFVPWASASLPVPPAYWSVFRDPYAEVLSVEKQLAWARQHGFQGIFYIAHVSTPETVQFVLEWRQRFGGFNVQMEVTWHHMFLNDEAYAKHGHRARCNPPLRDKARQEKLLDMVRSGLLDVIGTDHAPHPLARKDDPVRPASGLPGIPFYPEGIRLLRKLGINDHSLNRMLFYRPRQIFNACYPGDADLLPEKVVTKTYDPSLWDAYGHNPFEGVSERYG